MAHILLVMDDISQATGPAAPADQQGSVHKEEISCETQKVPVFAKTDTALAGKSMTAREIEEVRMDRVETLRGEILRGTYHVSAADVADKILHSMHR